MVTNDNHVISLVANDNHNHSGYTPVSPPDDGRHSNHSPPPNHDDGSSNLSDVDVTTPLGDSGLHGDIIHGDSDHGDGNHGNHSDVVSQDVTSLSGTECGSSVVASRTGSVTQLSTSDLNGNQPVTTGNQPVTTGLDNHDPQQSTGVAPTAAATNDECLDNGPSPSLADYQTRKILPPTSQHLNKSTARV